MNDDLDTSLERPLAVITGASSGIGFELAKEFGRNRFDLLVVAEDPGIAEAGQALRQTGAEVESVQLDLSKRSGVEQLYRRIEMHDRPVEALVVNAGVGVGGDFAIDTDLNEELKLINLNVTSSVHLTKLVVRDMVERGEGKILFTSSISSTAPSPFEAVYGASKVFLQSFALALREELKDSGITVSSLMPGPTETNFFHRAGMDDTKVGSIEKDDPAMVARQGFKAMMEGKDHVIAGSLFNKVFGLAGKFLPDTIGAKLHRRLSEPGSAKN